MITALIEQFTQLILLIALPFLQIGLGKLVIDRLERRFAKDDSNAIPTSLLFPLSFVLGLLIHLTLTFFLLCLGLNWFFATLLPLVYPTIKFASITPFLRSIQPRCTFNFALWFFVVLATGVSLFEIHGPFETIWINNYGDLTFHLGTITSFVYGDNFPPHYHIFPGVRFSYPFFINLWTAMLWWAHPIWGTLHLIFVLQWLILWMLVYSGLNGNRFWILPWVLFFGGATYAHLGELSHTFIGKNYPWTGFLTTIWVTQRGALFGIAIGAIVLQLFHHGLIHSRRFNPLLAIICGLLIALAPLVHTHIALTIALYMAVVFCVHALRTRGEFNQQFFNGPFLFGMTCLGSIVFLPWLLGKASIISWKPGWMPWQAMQVVTFFTPFVNASLLWLNNALVWLLSIVLLWVLSRRHKEIGVIVLLFLLANVVHIAIWEWDQIKIFIALYLICFSLWASIDSKALRFAQILLVLLIIPGACEFWRVLADNKKNEIYAKSEVLLAAQVRDLTPRSAVILAAPRHNSPVTLSGRYLYSGYDGTLFSHGLDYQARNASLKNPIAALSCKRQAIVDKSHCPDYLLWTNEEQRIWPGLLPEKMTDILEPTKNSNLFKIR
jgi:hypothetical protein